MNAHVLEIASTTNKQKAKQNRNLAVCFRQKTPREAMAVRMAVALYDCTHDCRLDLRFMKEHHGLSLAGPETGNHENSLGYVGSGTASVPQQLQFTCTPQNSIPTAGSKVD
jgi:hypothetical protein